MIFGLNEQIIFPDPALAEEDGLLAIGGDLSMERLLLAYQNGIFPWFSDDDPILWYSPHERCVIFPEKVKVSKSMHQLLKNDHFSITFNTAFESVISACAAIPRAGQDGTWITAEMQEAYSALHNAGYGQSVEVWKDGTLAGGLYGVAINGVFCGESMFSNVSNASKAALITLCRSGKYRLIDCQLPNDHLMRMGAEMISRDAYTGILKQTGFTGL